MIKLYIHGQLHPCCVHKNLSDISHNACLINIHYIFAQKPGQRLWPGYRNIKICCCQIEMMIFRKVLSIKNTFNPQMHDWKRYFFTLMMLVISISSFIFVRNLIWYFVKYHEFFLHISILCSCTSSLNNLTRLQRRSANYEVKTRQKW